MATQNPTSSSPQPTENFGYELEVVFKGVFLFALTVNSSSYVTGIDVFAPTCGHIYKGGFKDMWNNPYAPDPGPPYKRLLMLEPQRYCLELEEKGIPYSGQLPLTELYSEIGNQNLWPEQWRPVGQGWDFAVSIPVPNHVKHWTTMCMNVDGNFAGRNATFQYMGMHQKFKYKHVTKFNLRGSPFPLNDIQPAPPDGKLTFIIDGEPDCFPSIQHQRQAVNSIAQVMGLDLYLLEPITGGKGSCHSGDSGHIMDADTGTCMGGGIFQQPGN